MSGPAARLPARPSIAQLRKQAKERLRSLRTSDPTAKLSDAQYALATEYGFESWPKLVHHVESLRVLPALERYEALARDILAGHGGDVDALGRLIAHFGLNYSAERARRELKERLTASRGDRPGEPTIDEVRELVAHQYGHASWQALAAALTPKPEQGLAGSRGVDPPFYRIDMRRRRIQPRPPLSDSDWDTVFGVMRERGLTGLEMRGPMTDSAMAGLAELDFVTSITLEGGQALTDDGLLRLSSMPQLEELDLSGGHGRITDRGLRVLPELERLRRFSMCWAQQITDKGAAHLVGCEKLEHVDLMGTPTGDGVLEALRGKPRLMKLATGRLVTDAGLRHLHEYPVFKNPWTGDWQPSLTDFGVPTNDLLVDGPFTDAGIASLRELDGLVGLSFFWHANDFTSEGLAALAPLPNLLYLGCQGERCDDAAMRSIARLPTLRLLMAQGAVASDDGFVALSASGSIEQIWGRRCPNLSGRGFVALANMPSLRGLGVSCEDVDDASLAVLPRFPALQQLMPMDVTDDGFRHVGACEGLEDLICMYCRETGDHATAHISDLRLRTYYAGQTKITDRSLEILGRMTSLERVELQGVAAISDAGVAALASLPRLRRVSIGGAPRVSPAAMAVFGADVRTEYEP